MKTSLVASLLLIHFAASNVISGPTTHGGFSFELRTRGDADGVAEALRQQVDLVNATLLEYMSRHERDYLQIILAEFGQSISSVLRITGLTRTTLYRKLRQFGIKARDISDDPPE